MSRGAFRISICILVVLFGAAILYRNPIRAHYWAARLADSGDISTQGYYLACLANLGESAHGAAQRLARHPQAHVRSLAVFVLQRLPPESCIDDLASLLADADEAVRESAATALGFKGSPQAVRVLCSAARSDDGNRAAAAAAALGRVESPAAVDALCEAAKTHRVALVRAQALEALTDAILSGDSGQGVSTKAHAAPTSRPQCDPLAILVNALSDGGTFSGVLSLERQRRGAERFAGASTRPAPAEARRVREAAAAFLSTLTGRPVEWEGPWSDERKQATVEQCRQWIAARIGR
jgi:hypothetical protein